MPTFKNTRSGTHYTKLKLIGVMGIFLVFHSEAVAQHVSIHPLKSFRQAVREVEQLCALRGADLRACAEQKRRLKRDYQKLRDICREDRQDERCGMLMKPKRPSEHSLQAFCMKTPAAKKCVQRRERAKRRRIMHGKYCAKNPDAHRCKPMRSKVRRGYRNLNEYCLAKPSKKVCEAKKRKEMKKQQMLEKKTIRF